MGLVRFLLALSVVLAHAPVHHRLFGVTWLNPVTAVQAFYVISGFLITRVLAHKADYQSIPAFYASRWLRLWPAYIVIAIAATFANPQRYFFDVINLGWTGAFIAFSQVTLLFQDWLLFLNLTPNGGLAFAPARLADPTTRVDTFLPIDKSWTLGVEITFYLIAPFVCRRWQTLLMLFLAGVTVRLFIGALGLNQALWSYRFAPAEMTLFAAGGLAFFAGRWIRNAPWIGRAGWITLAIIVAFIVGRDVLYQDPFFARWFQWFSTTLWLVDPVFLAMLVIACPMLVFGIKGEWDRFIGDLSYPIYLSHTFVGGLLILNYQFGAGNWLYVFCTILFSTAVVLVIDRPTDRLRYHVANLIARRGEARRRIGSQTPLSVPAHAVVEAQSPQFVA